MQLNLCDPAPTSTNAPTLNEPWGAPSSGFNNDPWAAIPSQKTTTTASPHGSFVRICRVYQNHFFSVS